MRRFKAGDRVRALRDYTQYGIKKGTIYIVQEFPNVHKYPVFNPLPDGHGIIADEDTCELVIEEIPLFYDEGAQ